jgi:VWFA-related protein
MRGFSLRTLLPLFSLLCLPAFTQDTTTVRIGVALLRSGTDKVSVTEARDRLVKALNHQKVDKKRKISIQAVGLEASQGPTALAEAKDKGCEFVLFSHLSDVLTSSKPEVANLQGTINEVPVISAKVGYQLYRVLDSAEYAIGSAKGEDSSSMRDAVMQAVARVATAVDSDLKKGGNVPHRELTAADTLSPHTDPRSIDVELIGADFCKLLPTDVAHAGALRRVCEYAVSLPQRMPNFICEQETSRYRGDSQVPRDLITALVRYEDGNESYTEIKLNGQFAPRAITDSPGQWSSGEFGSNLRAIFDLHNQALFAFSGENKVGERSAWIFTYRIVRQNDPLWRLRSEDQVIAPPYAGELWVDQKTGDLLRFRSVATDIPKTFPTQSAELQTDYDNVGFADGTSFPLPVAATIATRRQGDELSRNVLQFRNCHKFRAKTRMLLDAPPGLASAGSETGGSTTSADLEGRREENNQIYAILREQAVQEDAAAIERQRTEELNRVTADAFRKLAALEKTRKQNLAELEANAKAAAPSPGPESLTTLRVTVKLVPVSVVLRDSKGNAIGNVQKEEFQLFDNGKPQVITSFSGEKTATEKSTAVPGTEANGGSFVGQSATPAPSATRDVAYVFDDIHASFGDLANSRDAAARHLAALHPEDRAAVFTTSGQIGLNFTSDHAKLQEVLKGLKPHPLIAASTCPPLTQYTADLVAQGDGDALGVAIADTIQCAFGGMASSPADMERAARLARATALEVSSAGGAEIQSTLSVLRDVVRRTSAAPGTRSIVLVSPGFLTQAPEVRQTLMELVDQALRANIVIHTLDMKGLSTVGVSGNTRHPSAPDRRQLATAEASAQSDVLAELAYGTGGTFFHNNNDVDEGFRRTADAPEYIYVLGFSPQTLDGKFHKLKVTLSAEARSGSGQLTIQARQGYYAIKPASGQ